MKDEVLSLKHWGAPDGGGVALPTGYGGARGTSHFASVDHIPELPGVGSARWGQHLPVPPDPASRPFLRGSLWGLTCLLPRQ